MVVYQTISPSLRAACTTFGSDPSCACSGITIDAKRHPSNISRISFIEFSSSWPAPPLAESLRPAQIDGHIDPIAVWVLDAMIGVLVRLGVDLRVHPGFAQPPLDVVKVVDFEAEMIDALFLIVALHLDQRDVDVAVGHIDRAAEAALGLQTKYFLIEFHHFFAILRHHCH